MFVQTPKSIQIRGEQLINKQNYFWILSSRLQMNKFSKIWATIFKLPTRAYELLRRSCVLAPDHWELELCSKLAVGDTGMSQPATRRR